MPAAMSIRQRHTVSCSDKLPRLVAELSAGKQSSKTCRRGARLLAWDPLYLSAFQDMTGTLQRAEEDGLALHAVRLTGSSRSAHQVKAIVCSHHLLLDEGTVEVPPVSIL